MIDLIALFYAVVLCFVWFNSFHKHWMYNLMQVMDLFGKQQLIIVAKAQILCSSCSKFKPKHSRAQTSIKQLISPHIVTYTHLLILHWIGIPLLSLYATKSCLVFEVWPLWMDSWLRLKIYVQHILMPFSWPSRTERSWDPCTLEFSPT